MDVLANTPATSKTTIVMEDIPTAFRAQPGFSGLVFGWHPWFGDITRVTYELGTPTAVAYLALGGWTEEALEALTSDYKQGIQEAISISREEVIAKIIDGVDESYCTLCEITPESPVQQFFRPI
jgi:hypothetical protein